ncbi:MAG: hypothetical protein RIR39_553 [Pseudomonadota bacterium]|jgi:hypothetical protein
MEINENNINVIKDIISAIAMDNQMAKDALQQKNYRAVGAIVERQHGEINKLITEFFQTP